MTEPIDVACLDEATLLASIEGRLEPDEVASIEAHVDRCETCREFLAAVARTRTAPSTGVATRFSPGERCDRYLILNHVGVGGMGIVYAAWDEALDRKLALKVVRPGSDAKAQERLVREAKAMAAVRHPNVVTVFEVGEVEAGVYIAMEYLRGGTLREWLREHPDAGWRPTLALFVQAGRGLAAAHAAGLVHRDFKPDNVLMEGGRACVCDFGLAQTSEAASVPVGESDQSTLAGTPAYMAPERASGTAADQYGLCVALWEGLFGVLPFTDGAACTPRTGEARANVPSRVRRVLERGLQRDPHRRLRSVRALLDSLEQAARPRPWGVLGVAVLGVVAAAAGWTSESDPCSGIGESWETGWNTQERERLRADFEATGAPYAADSFERFERRMDGYAARWADAATQVCVHPERPHTAQRRRCLDAAQAQAFSLIEALREPKREQLELAVRSAIELPPVQRCDSSDWRFGSDELADAAELVDELAVLLALQSSTLAERIPAVQARVEALDHPGLHARLAFIQGMSEKAQMQPEVALERFRTSARVAMAADLPHELFNAASLLAMTEAQQGRFDWAEHWQGISEALAERMGPRSRFTASALGQRGFIHRLRSQHKLARESLRRAHQLYASEDFPDAPGRIDVQRQLAVVLGELGEHDEAVRLLEEVVTQIRALYGNTSPMYGAAVGSLAVVHSTAGDLDASLEAWDESIRIASLAGSDDGLQTLVAQAERAVLLLRIEPERALKPLETALDRFGGSDSKRPITFILRDAIARAHARVGAHEEAVSGWRALLEDMEHLESSEIGLKVHIELGLELVRHEDLENARTHLERAAALATSLPDLSGPWSTHISVVAARLSLLEGNPQTETLHKAIETYEQEAQLGPELALAKFVLARTLASEGRAPRRVALLRREAIELAHGHDRVLESRIRAWQE